MVKSKIWVRVRVRVRVSVRVSVRVRVRARLQDVHRAVGDEPAEAVAGVLVLARRAEHASAP